MNVIGASIGSCTAPCSVKLLLDSSWSSMVLRRVVVPSLVLITSSRIWSCSTLASILGSLHILPVKIPCSKSCIRGGTQSTRPLDEGCAECRTSFWLGPLLVGNCFICLLSDSRWEASMSRPCRSRGMTFRALVLIANLAFASDEFLAVGTPVSRLLNVER